MSSPSISLSALPSMDSSPTMITSPTSTPLKATSEEASIYALKSGENLGILHAGALEKRRDGALRSGWARRYFILSTQGLHYFRKSDPLELFGEERGHVCPQLRWIGFTKTTLTNRSMSTDMNVFIDVVPRDR